MEVELSILKSLLESADELAAKDFAQDFLGKEVVFSCVDPAGVIGRAAAGGHDTMNVRVKIELLAPTMQDTEKTDLGTEVFWVASDFEKGFRAGTKQQIVEDLFILQHHRSQATGQSEDHVQVAGGEQFSLTRSDPAVPSGSLTLRAVPISAAIEGDGAMPATGALIEMTAKCGGTTPLHGPQHLDMLPTKPVVVSFDERLSGSADDIGHLQRRPTHLLLVRRLVVQC